MITDADAATRRFEFGSLVEFFMPDLRVMVCKMVQTVTAVYSRTVTLP